MSRSSIPQQRTIGKYKINKTLGSGMLKVKLVFDPVSGQRFAAKVCKDTHRKLALEKEANILRELNKLNIPNIIKCIEFIDCADILPKHNYQLDCNTNINILPSTKYKAALILELAPNNNMFDIIYYNQKLEEKVARTYFKKVIETMAALHAKGYVHRDLKPENILLDDKFQLKLADFGFAKEVSEYNKDRMKTKLGTESYMAPELFAAKTYSGEKTDAFACGVLLFLFIFGRPPFFKASSGDPYYKNFFQNKPEKFWKICEDKMNKGMEFNKDLKLLISDLLRYDPQERSDIQKVFDYEWMKGDVYRDEELIQVMQPMKDAVNEGKK